MAWLISGRAGGGRRAALTPSEPAATAAWPSPGRTAHAGTRGTRFPLDGGSRSRSRRPGRQRTAQERAGQHPPERGRRGGPGGRAGARPVPAPRRLTQVFALSARRGVYLGAARRSARPLRGTSEGRCGSPGGGGGHGAVPSGQPRRAATPRLCPPGAARLGPRGGAGGSCAAAGRGRRQGALGGTGAARPRRSARAPLGLSAARSLLPL